MYDKLTKKDIEKMEQEIEHRKLVVRREALEDVKEARAHGDLSENFEYKAAKKFKNENESRIRYLERMIKTAQIVEDDSSDSEVGLNDTVKVYFEDDDMEEEYKIVTTVRSDALNQMISIESPMGKALLKHKAGERVYVAVNDKTGYYVQIREIRKSDDESEEINKF
ncbi:MAG: transcription elongation factor GreA [Eubacterium sp.]|nr:transcription elongation factor GreA [Eubacterium sp.]